MIRDDIRSKMIRQTISENYEALKRMEDDIMTNVHLIKDESLGGLKREYVEVDRKADVGDYVICTGICVQGRFYKEGDVGKFLYYCDDYPSIKVKFDDDLIGLREDGECYVGNDKYRTLDPTDIVYVEGVRYKLVDRRAEVGEMVILTNPAEDYTEYNDINVGNIYEIVSIDYEDEEDGLVSVKGTTFRMYDSEYRVLEPLKSAHQSKIYTCDRCEAKLGDVACTNSKGGNYCSRICADKAEGKCVEVNASQASPAVIEMLANLSRRIVQLEDEIDTLHANQKRMAEELENAKVAEDESLVIVELAKLLVEAQRKSSRTEGVR